MLCAGSKTALFLSYLKDFLPQYTANDYSLHAHQMQNHAYLYEMYSFYPITKLIIKLRDMWHFLRII